MINCEAVDRLAFLRISKRKCGWPVRPEALAAEMSRISKGIARKVSPLGDPGLEIGVYESNYRLLKLMEWTHMSNIYDAQDRRTGQRVVIKEAKSERFIPGIQREAQILKDLQHPNIVKCLASGRFFLILEHLGRTRLANLKLAEEEALVLAFELVGLLKHIHQKQYVYRDFNDFNVMVTSEGKVKLLDFGLTKGPGEEDLYDRGFFGTPEFAAPEVVSEGAHQATLRSDMFSLGAILYKMLTGKLIWNRPISVDFQGWVKVPFPATGKILTKKWSRLLTLRCRPILEALLQREPEKRLTDHDELQRMILKALFLD